MLAKGLEKIVNNYGKDVVEWDHSPEFKPYRGHHAPITLKIYCNKYVGNFERELIGYAFGILDAVQNKHDFALSQRESFAKEVFHRNTPIDPEEESYELLERYLFESFQTVDDWEQITFYNIGFSREKEQSYIEIYFSEMPPIKWTSIFVPRIKRFFEEYAHSFAQQTSITEMYFENRKTKEKISIL